MINNDDQHPHNEEQKISRMLTNNNGKYLRNVTMTATLKVESLSPNVGEEHLKEIFGKYGTIIKINMSQHITGIYKDYAYIEFSTIEEAKLATRYMDGGQIDGLKISVEQILKEIPIVYKKKHKPIPIPKYKPKLKDKKNRSRNSSHKHKSRRKKSEHKKKYVKNRSDSFESDSSSISNDNIKKSDEDSSESSGLF